MGPTTTCCEKCYNIVTKRLHKCCSSSPDIMGRQTKEGRREIARDLGVVEWRTPVGRAERAGDREGESEMQTGILTRERKKRAIEGEKKNRRAEERTKEEGGKEEGRGNARGGEEKASRKGERGRRRR